MTFKIEFSDKRFRVLAPDGDCEEAVSYCSVSTVEYDGTVYGAYLAGDEEELETLAADTTPAVMTTEQIKVYSFRNWPALESVDTEIEEIDFVEDALEVDSTLIPTP